MLGMFVANALAAQCLGNVGGEGTLRERRICMLHRLKFGET